MRVEISFESEKSSKAAFFVVLLDQHEAKSGYFERKVIFQKLRG